MMAVVSEPLCSRSLVLFSPDCSVMSRAGASEDSFLYMQCTINILK